MKRRFFSRPLVVSVGSRQCRNTKNLREGMCHFISFFFVFFFFFFFFAFCAG